MQRSWLKRLSNLLRSSPRVRRPAWHLRIESLEDRFCPSTFTVNNLLDSGAGSLRQAILDANSHAGADLVQFANGLTGTISLNSELDVRGNVTIQGPGSGTLAVSGDDATRVISVATGANVENDGLTIAHGRATQGAGILNAGTLKLSADVLTHNVAQGAANGGNAYGGGLLNEGGDVTIVNSAITHNKAVGGDGGNNGPHILGSFAFIGFGFGGGILNDGGTLAISGSKPVGNLAQGGSRGAAGAGGTSGNGGSGTGPGVAAFTLGETSPTVSVNNSVFTFDSAVGGTGGSAGQGLGGALYIDPTAAVSLDAFTLAHFLGNHASTSNNDVFGSYT
jgi:hypothetical protein